MALAVIWMSVAVDIVLGLGQGVAGRATGPIRTFAVVAAGLVVAVSLLPHAIASQGFAGLGAALASVALVPALERGFRLVFRKVTAEGLRLELGYVGLVLHRVGDGVVMGVGGHGGELTWAIGAHEIPIVALVTIAYARHGLPRALVRAGLLGLASSCGYWLIRSMPADVQALHGWVDAIAAGVLVHILAYESLPDALHTARERASDVLAAGLGLLVILLPGADEHEAIPSVGHALLSTSLEAAPALLLGLVGSAAWLAQAGRRGHALSAAPAAPGVGLARPHPGLEAFTQLARTLGWLGTLGYALGAAALALVATAVVRWLAAGVAPAEAGDPATLPPRSFWVALEGLVLRVGGWLALGLLGATYVYHFVPTGLAAPAPALGALFVGAIALPASIASGCAVPIASALVDKGISPALAISGLALGAVGANAFSALRRARVGVLPSTLALAPLLLAWLALGAWLGPRLGASIVPPERANAGVLEWVALAGLGSIVCKSVWRVGIRGWLGASLQALAPAAARPPHAHAH